MGRSWLLSSLLHTALATLLWFGLPSWGRPLPAMEGAITVELVTEAPDDARPPEPGGRGAGARTGARGGAPGAAQAGARSEA